MNDWLNLFSGDLVIARGDVSKALDRLEAMGFRLEAQQSPCGQLVLVCTQSPLDARLASMKEFAHVARSED